MRASRWHNSVQSRPDFPGLRARTLPLHEEKKKNLLVVVDVDDGLLPLAGLDLAPEEDVDLADGAALHLGKPDPGHDEAHEARRAPDVTALATKVDTL